MVVTKRARKWRPAPPAHGFRGSFQGLELRVPATSAPRYRQSFRASSHLKCFRFPPGRNE